MAFPRKLLIPGEEIVVEAHPNWSILVRPIGIAVILLGGIGAAAIAWSSAPLWVDDVFAVLAALVILWLIGEIVSYRSRLLVITTTRVVYRWGVLRRTGREIPLDRVQDVTYHQTILERLVGAGSLLVESAGASGDEPFPDVRNPAGLQSLINQLVSGDRSAWPRSAPAPAHAPAAPVYAITPAPDPSPPPRGRTADWGSSGATDPHPTDPFPAASPVPSRPPESGGGLGGGVPHDSALAEQLRDLEHLHEAGVITDDEFDQKRRQILGL